jgi:hypothetical protein
MLAQDIFDVDFLDELVGSRKRILMKAMNSIVLTEELYGKSIQRDLKPFSTSVKAIEYVPSEQGRLGWFVVIVMLLQPYVNPDITSLPNLWNNSAISLLNSALRAFTSMVPWISSEIIAQSCLLAGISRILSIPAFSLDTKLSAAEVFYLIASRSYTSQNDITSVFGSFLNDGYAPCVAQCVQNLNATDDAAFDVMKILVQALADVGVKQICGKMNTSWIPNRLSEFISIILTLQQHPSVTLSRSIATFWVAALKHPYLRNVRIRISCVMMSVCEIAAFNHRFST